MQLRKIVKNRGHFPSDEAASKLLSLALRNIGKDWKMLPVTWKQAANQFAIGHAIQDRDNYPPLAMRTTLVQWAAPAEKLGASS